MEVLILIFGVFGALAIHLLASEVHSYGPWLARTLIRRASIRLPESVRIRYEEEWLGHLEQCPGNLAKLLHAVGCLICSRKLSQLSAPKKIPTAEDTMPFAFNDEKVFVDISTATYFLKLMRKLMLKEKIASARAFDSVIEDLEKRFALGQPDRDKLRELAAQMARVTEIATSKDGGNAGINVGVSIPKSK